MVHRYNVQFNGFEFISVVLIVEFFGGGKIEIRTSATQQLLFNSQNEKNALMNIQLVPII